MTMPAQHPLVFLDTETTSLQPDRRVWEAAFIRRDHTGTDAILLQVVDIDLTDADPNALRIGGFYDRHVDYAPASSTSPQQHPLRLTEADAARFVESITRGATLVGVGPAFDAECLATMLRRHRRTPSWHYSLVDVKAMAAGWLAASHDGTVDLGHPWSSDGLSQLCVVTPPTEVDRHTAMGDARWAMRLYDRLVGA